jgi:lipopolysaccharide/colanic/teichoic acid biosynthesis glycosyltransferase
MSFDLTPMYSLGKRSLDVSIALTALIVLAPVFAAVIVILRLSGEGEVFFRQKRIGYRNQPFDIWKFVTMRTGSELKGSITIKDDPRVLPIGRFLRKTKINELPQLINVLNGEMSIVGPRPLAEEGFDMYPDWLKSVVYLSKPGLTGIGSVVFRDEEEVLAQSLSSPEDCYRNEILPRKGAIEVWYQQNKSLAVDLKIVLLTAIAIVKPGSTLYQKWFKELVILGRSINTDDAVENISAGPNT